MASQDPWKWLGLLQWSLKYSDGTHTSEMAPMSAEDKAFLERVMKEGIINEGERMREILTTVTDTMQEWKSESKVTDSDEVDDLLQELRDIVEQIDYARAFMSMKGLDFLIGAIKEEIIPKSTKMMALGILSTMCQSNPPIQQQMIEMGAIADLSTAFFDSRTDDNMRARLIQAMSASVRSHELAEAVFCELEQTSLLLEMGLSSATPALQRRSLFLLNALVTSDTSKRSRILKFHGAIDIVLTKLLSSAEHDLRELALAMVRKLLEDKKSVNSILNRKDEVAALAVNQVASLRELTGEEKEMASVELEEWEQILTLLARAQPDIVEPENEAPLLLGAPPQNNSSQ